MAVGTGILVVVIHVMLLSQVDGIPRTNRILRKLERRFDAESFQLRESIRELWDSFESHEKSCGGIENSSSKQNNDEEGTPDSYKDSIDSLRSLGDRLKQAFTSEKRHLRGGLEAMEKNIEAHKQCVDTDIKDAFATLANGMILLSKSIEDTNAKLDRFLSSSTLQQTELAGLRRIPKMDETLRKVSALTRAHVESVQQVTDDTCNNRDDGNYCYQDWALPHSCADIQKTYTNLTSGVFTLYTRSNSPFTVYCAFRQGYGYTYISPTTAVDVNVNALHDDTSHVLVTFRDGAGAQYVSRFEQITRYKQRPLTIQYNSHHGYSGIVNHQMSPYLYVALLPRVGIHHKKDTQGYSVNGHDVLFTNCDGNPNSYFALLFNEGFRKTSSYKGGKSPTMNQLLDRATRVTSTDKVPEAFFSAYEFHFGGCGGFSTYEAYPNRPSATVGMRYEIFCSPPVKIPYGTLSATNGIGYGSVVTYVCDDGYKVIVGDVTRTCSASGTWTGILPICGST